MSNGRKRKIAGGGAKEEIHRYCRYPGGGKHIGVGIMKRAGRRQYNCNKIFYRGEKLSGCHSQPRDEDEGQFRV